MDNILNYKLIGISEFSHGIMESWIFRFNLLKYAMKNSNKNIIIFTFQVLGAQSKQLVSSRFAYEWPTMFHGVVQ